MATGSRMTVGVLVLCLWACSAARRSAEADLPEGPEHGYDPSGVHEAVFRKLIAQHDGPGVVFCLGVRSLHDGVVDPPPHFLSRFQNDPAKVTGISQCRRAKPGSVFVPAKNGSDQRTSTSLEHQRLIEIVTVESAFTFASEPPFQTAWLRGEAHCGAGCSHAERYVLTLEGATWVIQSESPTD